MCNTAVAVVGDNILVEVEAATWLSLNFYVTCSLLFQTQTIHVIINICISAHMITIWT